MKESVEEEKGCPRLVKFQDEEKKEEENEDELDSTELPPTVPQDSRESDLLRSKAVQVLKVWKQSPSSNSKSLVRIRQSEVTGGGHECAATPVCSVTYCAQARSNRMRRMLLSRLGASREQRDLISEPKQYRFASRQHCERRGSCLRRCWDRITGAGDDEDKLFKNRLSLASLIAQHLNWTYRASFMMVFLNFAIGFWGFTVIWAGLILATATFRPECMKVGALHVTETERHFYSDAYALSWTTFSTVGYGLVYPQIYGVGDTRCAGMNILCALEAFCGVLFASFCGAILFGKISRIQSVAHVAFSDPLVIRYGSGVQDYSESDDGEEIEASDDEEIGGPAAYPILEFRIVNLNYDSPRGEILSSSVNVHAVIIESKASGAIKIACGIMDPSMAGMKRSSIQKEVGKLIKSPQIVAQAGADGLNFLMRNVGKLTSSLTTTKPSLSPIAGALDRGSDGGRLRVSTVEPTSSRTPETSEVSDLDQHNILEEGFLMVTAGGMRPNLIDEGSPLSPPLIYSPMELETSHHPAFKRVWTLQHQLNGESPLLTGAARKMIAENGGKWPRELDNYMKIRESIEFHRLIVSFKGTSNATGSTVYKQQVYTFSQVNVGYQFVSLLHRDMYDGIGVDVNLINDVVEQRGGGGEPFESVEHDVLEGAVGTLKDVAAGAVYQAEHAMERTKDQMKEVARDVTSATNEKWQNLMSAMKSQGSNEKEEMNDEDPLQSREALQTESKKEE